MTKHSYFPYTSTYSSTRHNTNRKHNIPYTNIQHTSTLQGSKPISNNGRYTTNIHTDPHTVTTTYIKISMHHIHTIIVSSHLATRGNNTIQSRRQITSFTTMPPLSHPHTRHKSSLQLHPHTHPIFTTGFVDIPRRCDCTASQMDGEAGCWTTRGRSDSPH